MSQATIVLREGTSIGEARDQFCDSTAGAAPVVDEQGRPVGILSVRDVLATFGEEVPEVADLMTPYVIAVAPEASLSDALATMEAARIHHLPVVDDAGNLLGMVTALDIARAALERERALAPGAEPVQSSIDGAQSEGKGAWRTL